MAGGDDRGLQRPEGAGHRQTREVRPGTHHTGVSSDDIYSFLGISGEVTNRLQSAPQ
jgi:hypothetical protein